MNDDMKRCPGKEAFLDDAEDLPQEAFRRLVSRRARQTVDPQLPSAGDEEERKELESRIDKFFEKIHLGADFLPARFLPDGARRARAVCRISTPTSLGTGFLVAPGFLMTNNHVLTNADEAQESVAEFGFEEGGSILRVALEPRRFFVTHQDLDFTIVACHEQPVADLDPVPLLRNPATVTRNERVSIIQHPRGRRKEVALHDNKVSRVKDKVIHYTTDTEPGSSGSPVFNADWQLVGLHHAGWMEPGGKANNEGIRVASIVARLLEHSAADPAESLALENVLRHVDDSSPYLGFFDYYGVGAPGGQEIEVPDFTGTPDFADIGVWNIEHFNDEVSDQRVADVADVVGRLALDVMGMTEVQEGALERLVVALGQQGFSMGFEVLNVPGAQDIAVLFDRDTTRVEHRSDLNERHRELLTATTDAGKTAFPREPMFAKCAVGEEDTAVEFLMIVVHFKAFGDAQSRARRRLASRNLATIIEDIREQEGLPVVLGGDFNERLHTDTLAALQHSPDLTAMTADDATDGAISFVGQSHRSLIDHMLVSRDVRLGEIQGDDAAIVRLDQSVSDFSDRVSDHVPIVFRMVMRDQPIEVPSADAAAGVTVEIPAGARRMKVDFGL